MRKVIRRLDWAQGGEIMRCSLFLDGPSDFFLLARAQLGFIVVVMDSTSKGCGTSRIIGFDRSCANLRDRSRQNQSAGECLVALWIFLNSGGIRTHAIADQRLKLAP